MDRIVNHIREWQNKSYYAVSVTLIMGGLAVAVFFMIWGALIKETEHRYEKDLAQEVQLLEKEMSKRFEILDMIANMEEIENEDASFQEKANLINKKVRCEGLIRIGIADVNGIAYATDEQSIDIKEYTFFKKAMQGEKVIEGPISSEKDDQKYMVYSEPIYQDQKIYGIVYTVYDFEYIKNIMDVMITRKNWDTIVLDSESTTIFKTTGELEQFQQGLGRLFLTKIKQENYIASGYELYDEQEIFWLAHLIPETEWIIMRMAPINEVFIQSNKISTVIGLILLVVIAYVYGKLQRNYEQTHKKIEETENLDNIMVLRVNARGEITYANKFARKNLGFSKEEILKRNIKDLLVYNNQEHIDNLLYCKKNVTKIMSMALDFQTKEYKRLYAICTVKVLDQMTDDQGIEISAVDDSEYNLVSSDKDVVNSLYKLIASSEEELQHHARELMAKQSQLEESEKQLRQMLYYDDLTNMPNKNWLKGRMSTCLENNRKFTIVIMDVDNFKFVNDSFGHDYGDEILTAIGAKLESLKDDKVEIFRLGADEFAILMKDSDEGEQIEALLIQIQTLFQEQFVLNDIKFDVSFSMGVAMYPKDGESYNELMTNADTAMNRAKENGKRHYIFFDHQFKKALLEKIKIENDLRRAIKNNEFVLYYQPQTDVKTGRIKGFEALIRWIDQTGVIIPPFKFIDIAEESGLIIPIGKWVIEEGCRFINRLGEMGYDDLYVAVNVSVVQLIQGEFSKMLEHIIEETKVNPKLLHIEITETILMESIEANIETVQRIKAQGAQVSLDDFGKGYSSLTYLKKLPIDVLKIEKTFIDDILIDQEKNITSAIINLGHDLNLEVVAEGVETIEQKQYLANYGCDIIQGYLVSKPIPEEQIVSLLEKYNH